MDETAKTIETLIKNEKATLRKLLSELSDEEIGSMIDVAGIDQIYSESGKLRDVAGIASNIVKLEEVAENLYVA